MTKSELRQKAQQGDVDALLESDKRYDGEMDNTSNSNKTSITCMVKKIVFRNKENGYSVLSSISDSEEGPFSNRA